MPLALDLGTEPAGLAVKTFGIGPQTVYLGSYEISMRDFLRAAEYVLRNTDLEPNDPRPQFVKCVRSMREAEGYSPGGIRLVSTVPPVPPPLERS